MENSKKTIVYFHTGRGGRFHNAGYVTFNGDKNISEVIQMNDNGKRNSYLSKENETEIYKILKDRDLNNLLELFDRSRDNDDFTRFEKITGFDLGEDVYTDCNGNQIITVAEAETGVGTLNWDGAYDSDCCMLLSDCDEDQLTLIANSDVWNKESLIQEYFDENTDLAINWNSFDGRYTDLIDSYFNYPSNFDANDFVKIIDAD